MAQGMEETREWKMPIDYMQWQRKISHSAWCSKTTLATMKNNRDHLLNNSNSLTKFEVQ